MRRPFPRQFEVLAGVQFGQIADDGDERVPAAGILERQHPPRIRFETQDGVAVFFVVEGDALDGAGDLVGGTAVHPSIVPQDRTVCRITLKHLHQPRQ